MPELLPALQVLLALGIVNVWIFRFGKASAWRGGTASNMKEEFAAYGLPAWAMTLIGALKLSCAAALLAGLWFPALVQPAATVLASLMAGAVLMHVKVTDPPMRSLPAFLMLVGCVTVVTM